MGTAEGTGYCDPPEVAGKVVDLRTLRVGDRFTVYETDHSWWQKIMKRLLPWSLWLRLPDWAFRQERTGRATEWTVTKEGAR